MSTPFKLKGSPMQRNFGVGSPARKTKTPTEYLAAVDVSKLTEKQKKRYYAKVKEVTGSDVVKHKGKTYQNTGKDPKPSY